MFNISDSKAYLEKFRELIEKGAQLTRLAVQEPLGHMILKVKTVHLMEKYRNATFRQALESVQRWAHPRTSCLTLEQTMESAASSNHKLYLIQNWKT